MSSTDQNSDIIIELKQILNPEKTAHRGHDKDDDDQQEQKLVFDGYSELECLWVRDRKYDEKSELDWVNFKKLESVRQQQIKLLGSEQMYKRVNENLKNMKFEAHFAQEQSKLFHWRAKFFRKHFPLRDDDGEAESCWTCNVNITLYWPKVATFACVFGTCTPYFECSEEDAHMASFLYERKYLCGIVLEDVLSPRDLQEFDLTMKDVFHKFVSDYATEPLKLVHLALKNAIAYGLPLDQLPKTVQERAEKGLFTKISDIEKILSAEGKKRLARIRDTIEECRDEEDLNDFKDLDDFYQLK